MEEQPATATTNQESPRVGPSGLAFLWGARDADLSISLNFDLVDRLGFDVMRGFGAVPKRGAEVGGLLLGRLESREQTRLIIEDFLLVPCSHARGPSFLLSEADLKVFDQILGKAGRGSLNVVGFFRSNTRENLELTEEDLAVFGSRQNQDHEVVLLIKPHATRPPEAAFFLKRQGQLETKPSGDSFVFRRKELGGGRTPRRARQEEPAIDLSPAGALPPLPSVAVANIPEPATDVPRDLGVPNFGGLAPDIPRVEPEARAKNEPKTRSTWIWVPLSFIFLLLGIVLGFQIALSFRPPKPVEASQTMDPFVLGLSVSEFNSSLHLRWNPDSPAVRAGQKAILHIEDGQIAKSVLLDRNDLQRGGVLYKFSTGDVAFRLEVFTQEKTSISESVDIRMLAPEDGAPAAKK